MTITRLCLAFALSVFYLMMTTILPAPSVTVSSLVLDRRLLVADRLPCLAFGGYNADSIRTDSLIPRSVDWLWVLLFLCHDNWAQLHVAAIDDLIKSCLFPYA